MTVTEFCGDPIFEAAARYWPEREHGWQGRLSDLLDAVRASLASKINNESGLRSVKDATNDIGHAMTVLEDSMDVLRRFVADNQVPTKAKAVAA